MTENTQPVWLAVEEDSINILEGQSLVSLPAHHSNPVLFIIYLFFVFSLRLKKNKSFHLSDSYFVIQGNTRMKELAEAPQDV